MKFSLKNLERDNINDSISNQNNINIIKQNLITDAEINLALRLIQKIQRDNIKHDINDQNNIKCLI